MPVYCLDDMATRKLGNLVASELVQAFQQGMCSKLEQLHLGNLYHTTFSRDDTCKVMDALCAGAHKSLTHLYLNSNLMGDGQAVAVARVVALQHGLKVLDISNNYIGQRGCTALLTALQNGHGKCLESLNLSNNVLTDRDGALLVNCLRPNLLPNLKSLQIAKNYLTKDMLALISSSLDSFTTQVKLHHTQIALSSVPEASSADGTSANEIDN